jgi:hypothetical protein
MKSPVLGSLAAGYIPVIAGVVIFGMIYDVPFWLALVAVLFLGAGLTLLVATFRAAPELERHAGKADRKAVGNKGDSPAKRQFIASKTSEHTGSG